MLEDELLREGSHPRCEVTDEMLSLLDVLVDGRFIEALKDISLPFRGSSNQRIIRLGEERWGDAGEAAFLKKAPPQTPPGKHFDPRNENHIVM